MVGSSLQQYGSASGLKFHVCLHTNCFIASSELKCVIRLGKFIKIKKKKSQAVPFNEYMLPI